MYIMPFSAEQKKRWTPQKGSRRTISAAPFRVRIAKRRGEGGSGIEGRGQERTCKRLGHFCGDEAESVEVCLVSDENDDDVWARVLAQLFDPCLKVAERRGLCDVVH
jgi:hypothetical protein